MSQNQILQYKFFIKVTKIVALLVLLGFISMVIIPLMPHTNSNKPNQNYEPLKHTNADIKQNYAENPQFLGSDDNNRPYLIEAETGIQGEKDMVTLEKVRAEYTLDNNEKVELTSKLAVLATETHELNLQGEIRMNYAGKYELSAEKSWLNYKSTNAKGSENVILTSNFGELRADNFEVTNNYNDIRFYGSRVKTKLYKTGNYNEK